MSLAVVPFSPKGWDVVRPGTSFTLWSRDMVYTFPGFRNRVFLASAAEPVAPGEGRLRHPKPSQQ